MIKRYRGMVAFLLAFALCFGMIPLAYAAESAVPTETQETQGEVPASVPEITESSEPTPSSKPTEPSEPVSTTGPTEPTSQEEMFPMTFTMDDGISPIAGGSSGSNTNMPGTNAPGGKGTLHFASYGITMQVVYHPYNTLLAGTGGMTDTDDIVQKIRENSYDNIIDLVTDSSWDNSYSNIWTKNVSGSSTTVYNGRSINPSYTFVIDPYDGYIYRIGQAGNGTLDLTNGRWYFTAVKNGNMYRPDTGYTRVSTEKNSAVESFIRELCDGLGSWDKEDVARNASGGEASSYYDDYSLYCYVLEYLGCDVEYINNYVAAYTGQLAADDTALVPSIIWSFIAYEMQGQTEYADIYPVANIADSHTLNTDLYTSDASPNRNGGFAKSWWTSALPYGDDVTDLHHYFNENSRDRDVSVFSACHNKPTSSNSSWACLTAFGHDQTYYGGHGFGPSLGPNTPINAEGAGFVNRINADGVDANAGDQYYHRGYWTAYGSPNVKPPVPKGQIGVTKAVEGITANYSSLGNWAFDVYRDAGCTSYVTTIYTTGSGDGYSGQLDPGTYYVVEAPYNEQAGRGDIDEWYIIDAPVVSVTVEDGTVAWAVTNGGYTAKNGCGKQIQIRKTSDCSADQAAQLSGNPMYSLAGAEYDVYSSDGTYLETLTTGSNGKSSISQTRFPTGFSGYLVETVAPKGHSLNTAKVTFSVTSSSPNIIEISVTDKPIFGSLLIQKADSLLGANPQGSATLAGAVFEVINENSYTVKVGTNAAAAKGVVCATLTADSTGIVTTGEIFPLGSYSVREKKAPDGYELNTAWKKTFSVTESSRSPSFTVMNDGACYDEVFRGGVIIVKEHSVLQGQTGADACFEGITFTIYSDNDNAVMVDGKMYLKDEAVMTLEVKWDGSRWCAETAPDALPYGTYTIRENPMAGSSTLANAYYFLNGGSETLTINGAAMVKTVTFRNAPRPGKISLEKVNYEGQHLAGAKFLLEWSADGTSWQPVFSSNEIIPGACNSPGLVDGCLVTPASGIIEFTGLDSRMHYRLTELEAPEGYHLLTGPVFEGNLPAEDMELQLRAINGRTFELPKTGSSSLLILRVVCLLCVTLCLMLSANEYRKKRG